MKVVDAVYKDRHVWCRAGRKKAIEEECLLRAEVTQPPEIVHCDRRGTAPAHLFLQIRRDSFAVGHTNAECGRAPEHENLERMLVRRPEGWIPDRSKTGGIDIQILSAQRSMLELSVRLIFINSLVEASHFGVQCDYVLSLPTGIASKHAIDAEGRDRVERFGPVKQTRACPERQVQDQQQGERIERGDGNDCVALFPT